MIGFDATRDAAILADAPASARYHREAVEQIVQCVEEGVYCALLGPRLCGKTLLLRYIQRNLAPLLGWTCAYIDLLELRATTQRAFFSDLIRQTASRLSEITDIPLPVPEEGEASSAVFRAFLSDCLEATGRDLVLLIDPLDALPTDLIQALLTSLRAAYMDQQTTDRQVIVVISGALSLATLTVGESSPFRGIARRVFVGDLSESDSLSLILEFLLEGEVSVTRQALQKLLATARGDTYLIRRISQGSAELARSRSSSLLRSREINHVTARFLRDEVYGYAPLIEAIRLIEEDPDLVECILLLLERDSVPRGELPLPLSPDMDPLLLTGVVDRVDGDQYRLQNLIYRQFLAQHFSPGRVGYVLSMAGRWDSAIDYLAAGIIQGNQQSRLDLLPAAINSMYAAQDLAQAVHFLRRALSTAFGVSDAQVWLSQPNERHLLLIGYPDVDLDGRLWADLQIPHGADRLEARAFRQGAPLRGQEGESRVVRAIPLQIHGRKPIGVATIYDDPVGNLWTEQRERDLQLVGFLNQAARALQAVSLRRQELTLAGRVQANLLPERAPDLPGWEISATWRPARETSGDFYDFFTLPNGRLGLLIADVVDKGMGAALLMALSRTLIRTYAPEFPDHPERVLEVVNRRIIADIQSGLFLTLFYGILDPATGSLAYCNAGHPPPYIFLQDEGDPAGALTQFEALHRTGMPVGISEDAAWETASTSVLPGALLLLYTDGIIEAQNPGGELFGEAKILETLRAIQNRPPHEVWDALISNVYAFAGPQPQLDDITLVVLRRE